MVRKLQEFTPEIGKECFIAETAAVIGDVKMGDQCSIWYSAVLRGDVNSIILGNRVNVQDCSVLHCTRGENGKVIIADDVIIGHNATVHGAKVASKCLIGMGATVLDGSVIENGSIVAAHALVLSNTHIGPNELWGGVPAKFIKKISPEFVERKITPGVESYVNWAKIYREERQ